MPLLALFDISVDVPLVVLLVDSMPLFVIAVTMPKLMFAVVFYATIGTVVISVNLPLVVVLAVSL
jgi:hypothetical protein